MNSVKKLTLENILNEVEGKRDIIITIPSSVKWEEYQKELDVVKDYSQVMNFKISNLPKETSVGCKCYLCYKGQILGWMKIVGMEEKEFECSTTGKSWKGKFILRSGPFNEIEPIQMKGFQGFRYF
jgi:hypothetical protein